MRGLAVAGSRPSQGVAAQIKNADIEDVSQLGAELLARPASGLGQRRLTHRNPDLRATSIDQRGAPIPAVRGTEIERQGSTQSRPLRRSRSQSRVCARAAYRVVQGGTGKRTDEYGDASAQCGSYLVAPVAIRQYGILQGAYAGEPGASGRGVEPAKLLSERGDTLAIAI